MVVKIAIYLVGLHDHTPFPTFSELDRLQKSHGSEHGEIVGQPRKIVGIGSLGKFSRSWLSHVGDNCVVMVIPAAEAKGGGRPWSSPSVRLVAASEALCSVLTVDGSAQKLSGYEIRKCRWRACWTALQHRNR